MFDLKSIQTRASENPRFYVLKNEALETAIQMAIWLEKPLLLTGAPGTGKTQLAYKIADLLTIQSTENPGDCAPFLPKPFVFNTKTTSTASDLFYYYDAVRHFQKRYIAGIESEMPSAGGKVLSLSDKSSETKTETKTETKITIAEVAPHDSYTAHQFITMNALGKAILQAYGKKAILEDDALNDLQLLNGFDQLDPEPKSCVVLIDEIDKAPRDFPNDLLNEIEHMEFYITELINKHIKKPDNNARIIVIMTSNFEKNLPDAFLRRCLFYHIPSPQVGDLIEIVETRITPHLDELYKGKKDNRLNQLSLNLKANIESIVNEFYAITEQVKDKKPTTSELLEWIKTLEQRDFFNNGIVDFKTLNEQQKSILQNAIPALTKNKDDAELLTQRYMPTGK